MTRKSQPELAVHSSLGLQALCQRLQGVASCGILDLGPVRSVNIEFWSRFSSSIYIADLRSSLPLPVLDSEESESERADWDGVLGLPADGSYDVILAWDLLNYLDLPAVAELMRYLSRVCRPGTVLFALVFDQKQMPEEITIYRIVDESHLAYECGSLEMQVCPRHHPRALAGAMSQFQTASSFRLRNGVVEYLFVYEEEKEGQSPVSPNQSRS